MFVIHNHVIKSGRLIFYGSCDDGKHVAQRGEHQVGYNFACAGCLVCQQDYPKKTTEQISVKLGTEPLFFFLLLSLRLRAFLTFLLIPQGIMHGS